MGKANWAHRLVASIAAGAKQVLLCDSASSWYWRREGELLLRPEVL